MMQRQERHPKGTFPACSRCASEPRHIVGRGSHRREAFNVMQPTGTRHQLECRCGTRTGWLPTLAEAEGDWRAHYAVREYPVARVRTLHPVQKEQA